MPPKSPFLPTAEQKAAIEHFREPALVFAGPGSGKTEVIARRVARLILHEKVAPEQILITTFTNKATDELRVRVSSVIRDESDNVEEADRIASKLNIGTIHSLCYRIMREFGFKYEASAKPVLPATEDDQILFLNRFYDEFGLKTFYAETKEEWKARGGDPFVTFMTSVCTAINTISEEVDRPDRGSLPSPDTIKNENVRRFLEVYVRYRAKMKELNRIDQSMVLSDVAKILNQQPEIAKKVRETWPFALVDEYQDTSPVQDEIFRIIYAPNGNIMVVGDDDQSIYRFRGAEPRLFRTFSERFTVDPKHSYYLTENRRASHALVSFTKGAIEHNHDRVAKDLHASSSSPKGDSPLYFQSDEVSDQVAVSVAWIKDLVERKQIPSYRNAAILAYSAKKAAGDVSAYCKEQGIPCRIESDKAFLKNPSIKAFIDILSAAQKPEELGDTKFRKNGKVPKAYQALGRGQAKREEIRSDIDFWSDRIKNSQKGDNLLKLFYAFIDRYNVVRKDIDPDTMRALGEFSVYVAKFEEGRRSTAFQAPTTMLDAYATPEEPVSPNDVAVLETGEKRYPPDWLAKRLDRFFRYLSMLDISNEPEPQDEFLLLTTIHKAKGLEFDAVAIVGVDDWAFPGSLEPGLREEIRQELLGEVFQEAAVLEEKRRLLYVAATRARRVLLITATDETPSPFLAAFGLRSVSEKEILGADFMIEAPKLHRSRETLRLSHSEVSSYLECPKRYELEHRYSFQGLATPALRLGSALHRAIENAHRWQIESGALLHDTRLKEIFRLAWPFPVKEPKEQQQFSDYEQIFLNYFQREQKLGRSVVSVERDLAVVRSSDILTGKIDVQQALKGVPVVVEIKLNYNPTNLRHAKEQLNTYSLAFPNQEIQLEACFLKGAKHREEVKRLDPAIIGERVSHAFGKIRERAFAATPCKEKCSGCRMNRICNEGNEILKPGKAA